MIKKALEFLQDRFIAAKGAELLHQDESKQVWLLPSGTMHTERKQIWAKDHIFDHIEDFVDFMVSPEGKGVGGKDARIVFVNPQGIRCDLDYESEKYSFASMPFTKTRQRAAIERLQRGVTQKELFGLLYSDLFEAGVDELLACIRNIKLSKSEESKSSIEVDGLMSEGKQSLRITYPTKDGQKDATIPTDWNFFVPVWDQWPDRYSIPTRLEIDCSVTPILFRFHIRDLAGQERNWIRDVINHLRETVKETGIYWGIYWGTYADQKNDVD